MSGIGINSNDIHGVAVNHKEIVNDKNEIYMMDSYEKIIQQAERIAQEGNIQDALMMYKEAIDLKPECVEGYYNVALLYYEQNDLDNAINNFEIAAKLKSDASIFKNLGGLYYSKGMLEEAEINYKEAIRLKRNYLEGFYGLGSVFLKRMKYFEAISTFENCLKIHPSYEKAKEKLEECFKANLEEKFRTPKKRLLVFWHGIGDNIMATPSLRALRKKYPDDYIGYMYLHRIHKDRLMEHNPYLDALYTCSDAWGEYPDSNSGKKVVLAEAGALAMREEYDEVLPIAMQACPLELHRMDKIAYDLSVELDSYDTELTISEEERQRARMIFREWGITDDDFVIAIHRRGADVQKYWDVEETQKFVNYMKSSYNAKFVTFETHKDLDHEKDTQFRGDDIFSTVTIPDLSLKTSAALIEQCNMFAGIDSGPMWLATTTEVPIISLFTMTKMHLTAPMRSGSYIVCSQHAKNLSTRFFTLRHKDRIVYSMKGGVEISAHDVISCVKRMENESVITRRDKRNKMVGASVSTSAERINTFRQVPETNNTLPVPGNSYDRNNASTENKAAPRNSRIVWPGDPCQFCGGTLIGPVIMDLMKCGSCGMYRKQQMPSKEYLRDYFKEFTVSSFSDKDEEESRRREARYQLALIEKYATPGKIFDVGASGGVFMKVAKEHGWQVEGNEISHGAINYALKKFDVKIQYGFLEDLNNPENSYDAVVLWHILEHTLNPKEILNICHKMLRPSGVLLIGVPEKQGVDLCKHYESLHTYEFNRNNLYELSQICGFKLLEIILRDQEEVPQVNLLYRKCSTIQIN